MASTCTCHATCYKIIYGACNSTSNYHISPCPLVPIITATDPPPGPAREMAIEAAMWANALNFNQGQKQMVMNLRIQKAEVMNLRIQKAEEKKMNSCKCGPMGHVGGCPHVPNALVYWGGGAFSADGQSFSFDDHTAPHAPPRMKTITSAEANIKLAHITPPPPDFCIPWVV